MRGIRRHHALGAYICCFMAALLICAPAAFVRAGGAGQSNANRNVIRIGRPAPTPAPQGNANSGAVTKKTNPAPGQSQTNQGQTVTTSTPVAKSGKKSNLTPATRLRLALEKSKSQSALLPVAMHTLERGLKGPSRKGNSALDAIFDQVLKRHPGVSKALLQKLVTDWNALPATTRDSVSPPALRKLDAAQPLQMQTLKPTFMNVVTTNLSKPSLTLDRSWAKVQQNTLGEAKTAQPLRRVPWMISPEPVVSRLEPSAPAGGYSPGQSVTVRGYNFSKDKAANTVVIYKKLGNSKAEWKRLAPTLATGLAMEVKLPADIAPGQHFIKLEVKKATGKVEVSKHFTDLPIKTPPPPAPKITGISPPDFKPGQDIVISGSNFNFGSAYVYAYFKPLEGQPLEPYNSVSEINGEKAGWSLAKVLGPGQVQVEIPETLFPGKYIVAVNNANTGLTNWVEYDVRPHRFKVNFTQIACKDESDPEGWGGSDEVVAAWLVVGDTFAWNKLSTEYEGFDDGTVKAFHGTDQSVFMVDGSQKEVSQVLAISTLLFEWDSGDVKSANQAIGFVGDLAAAILSYIYGPKAGAIVQEVVPYIQQVVAWLGGNPDNLGRRDLYFSAYDLYHMTAQSKKYVGELNFDNNDDTGSYRLTYEVYRE